MFDNDSKQQIEKKMLLLEGIALLKEPSHVILMDLMLRDERMNYFEFTHYLSELMESRLITEVNANRYQLTERGENAIHFFLDRASVDAISALKSTVETLNIQSPLFSFQWEIINGKSILNLMSAERGTCLMLSLEDRKLGDAIGKAWIEQNRQALSALMNVLTDSLFAPKIL